MAKTRAQLPHLYYPKNMYQTRINNAQNFGGGGGGGFTPFPIAGTYIQLYDPANNYNATTGVWLDQSGNSRNTSASGTKPALSGDLIQYPTGNENLAFPRSTAIRSVFWVVRINSIKPSQFLLGDGTTFDFHGDENEYFDSTFASGNIIGQTFRRNDSGISPGATQKTTGWQALCLVTSGNVAAQNIAYDRAITDRSLRDCDLRALIISESAWTGAQMTEAYDWAVENNLLV